MSSLILSLPVSHGLHIYSSQITNASSLDLAERKVYALPLGVELGLEIVEATLVLSEILGREK